MFNLRHKLGKFFKNVKGAAVVEASLAFVPYLFLVATILDMGRLAMTQSYFEVAMQEAIRELQPTLNDRSKWNMPDDPRKVTEADERNYINKLRQTIKDNLPGLIIKYYSYYASANSSNGYMGIFAIRLGPKNITLKDINLPGSYNGESLISSTCVGITKDYPLPPSYNSYENDKHLMATQGPYNYPPSFGTCSYIVAINVKVNYKWVVPVPMLIGQTPDEVINRTLVFYQEALPAQ